MRKQGYYWVRTKLSWLVRFWDAIDECWHTGESLKVADEFWEEIDERQIIRDAT